MNVDEFILKLNAWGNSGTPFFFYIDFELKKPVAMPLAVIDPDVLHFEINGYSNATNIPSPQIANNSLIVDRFPPSYDTYRLKFETVQKHLAYGDTFLTNLTLPTRIQLRCTLEELFIVSKAKYRLWIKDSFLVFSPETFVQIRDGRIYSYPMKGTIDASLPNARQHILADRKELAEHVTIVDLIRNDLSQVASAVHVSRFRYLDEIKTNSKTLLQVSSEIVGELPAGYNSRLGEILVTLLPAGSVSGAPKPKTLAVIREAEGEDRGYYTGVMGYFDGVQLDTGVMIRYIERRGDDYYYRSGGGITTQSVAPSEYEEVIDKVYVPIT